MLAPEQPSPRHRRSGERKRRAPSVLRADNTLRTLQVPGDGTRTLYGLDGIVHASDRPERYWFWPLGIPSAGAMRQWGHHATAFVGRRHFDEPFLVERYFALKA